MSIYKIPLYDNNDSLLFSFFPPYIYTLELINLLFFLVMFLKNDVTSSYVKENKLNHFLLLWNSSLSSPAVVSTIQINMITLNINIHAYIHTYTFILLAVGRGQLIRSIIVVYIFITYIRYTYYIRTYVHTYIHTITRTVYTIYILHSYTQFKKLENETAKSSVKRLVDDSDRCSTHIQGNIEKRLATYYIHIHKCIHTYMYSKHIQNKLSHNSEPIQIHPRPAKSYRYLFPVCMHAT